MLEWTIGLVSVGVLTGIAGGSYVVGLLFGGAIGFGCGRRYERSVEDEEPACMRSGLYRRVH